MVTEMTLQKYTDLCKRARELADKATPGPWTPQESMDNGGHSGCGPKHNGCYQDCYNTSDKCSDALQAKDDSEFIAASRTLIPDLCGHIEMLTEALGVAQAVLGAVSENASKTNLGKCCIDDSCHPAYGHGWEQIGSCSFQAGVNRGFVESADTADEALEQITAILEKQ